mgnify:CR=1 FL=1
MPRRARNNNTNSNSNSNSNNTRFISPKSVLNKKPKNRTPRRQRRRTIPQENQLSPGILSRMWGWAAGTISSLNNNNNN